MFAWTDFAFLSITLQIDFNPRPNSELEPVKKQFKGELVDQLKHFLIIKTLENFISRSRPLFSVSISLFLSPGFGPNVVRRH